MAYKIEPVTDIDINDVFYQLHSIAIEQAKESGMKLINLGVDEKNKTFVGAGEFYIIAQVADLKKDIPSDVEEKAKAMIKKYLEFFISKNAANKVSDKQFKQIEEYIKTESSRIDYTLPLIENIFNEEAAPELGTDNTIDADSKAQKVVIGQYIEYTIDQIGQEKHEIVDVVKDAAKFYGPIIGTTVVLIAIKSGVISKQLGLGLLKVAKSAASSIGGIAKTTGSGLIDIAKSVGGVGKSIVGNAAKSAKAVGKTAVDLVKNNGILNSIFGTTIKIGADGKISGKGVQNAIGQIATTAYDATSSLAQQATDILGKTAGALGTTASTIGKTVGKTVGSAAKTTAITAKEIALFAGVAAKEFGKLAVGATIKLAGETYKKIFGTSDLSEVKNKLTAEYNKEYPSNKITTYIYKTETLINRLKQQKLFDADVQKKMLSNKLFMRMEYCIASLTENTDENFSKYNASDFSKLFSKACKAAKNQFIGKEFDEKQLLVVKNYNTNFKTVQYKTPNNKVQDSQQITNSILQLLFEDAVDDKIDELMSYFTINKNNNAKKIKQNLVNGINEMTDSEFEEIKNKNYKVDGSDDNKKNTVNSILSDMKGKDIISDDDIEILKKLNNTNQFDFSQITTVIDVDTQDACSDLFNLIKIKNNKVLNRQHINSFLDKIDNDEINYSKIKISSKAKDEYIDDIMSCKNSDELKTFFGNYSSNETALNNLYKVIHNKSSSSSSATNKIENDTILYVFLKPNVVLFNEKKSK